MKSLLVGESAAPQAQRGILAAIEEDGGIERVIPLRTLHVGPESLLVAAKIAVSPGQDAGSIAKAIDAAESRIRAAVPIAGLIFLEPDLYAESKLNPADPAVSAVRTARAGRKPGQPRAQPSAPAPPSSPAP